MAKKFKKLVLTKDTIFDESIKVETSITCEDNMRYSLKVNGDIDAGNIDAGNIDAWNINAGNIDAGNIDAWNINAGNIDAGNINARDIVCEKRIKKSKTSKTISRVFIRNKSTLEIKEQMGA